MMLFASRERRGFSCAMADEMRLKDRKDGQGD